MWRLDWYAEPKPGIRKSVAGHRLFATREEAQVARDRMAGERPELRFTGPYEPGFCPRATEALR